MSSSASEHAIEPGARLMKTFSISVLNIRHRSGGQHHLVPYSLESSRPGTDSQTHTASQDLNLTWEIKSEIKTNKSKFQGCKCFWFLWPGLHEKVWRLSHLKRPCFSAPQDCKSLSMDPYMYIYLLIIPNDKCLAISSGKIFTTFLWSLLLAKGFANNLVHPSLRKKIAVPATGETCRSSAQQVSRCAADVSGLQIMGPPPAPMCTDCFCLSHSAFFPSQNTWNARKKTPDWLNALVRSERTNKSQLARQNHAAHIRILILLAPKTKASPTAFRVAPKSGTLRLGGIAGPADTFCHHTLSVLAMVAFHCKPSASQPKTNPHQETGKSV